SYCPSPCSLYLFFSLLTRPPPRSTLFPYTTLFRSLHQPVFLDRELHHARHLIGGPARPGCYYDLDRLAWLPGPSRQTRQRDENKCGDINCNSLDALGHGISYSMVAFRVLDQLHPNQIAHTQAPWCRYERACPRSMDEP